MDSREARDTSSHNMRDDKDSVYNSKERVELVEKAKHAEQAKRYDDMLVAMHEVAKLKFELNEEERNLWMLAFANLTQEKGGEIRNLNEKKKKSKTSSMTYVKNSTKPCLEDRIKSTEESVSTVCIDTITTIEKYLLPTSLTPDSKALYYLMKAICYQYMAESSRSAIEAQKLNEKAIEAYEKGSMVAYDELPATNLLRLDIAFYFSVLCSAMSRHERACSIANEAIKEVLDDIRKHSDELSIEECMRHAGSLLPFFYNLEQWNHETCRTPGNCKAQTQDLLAILKSILFQLLGLRPADSF